MNEIKRKMKMAEDKRQAKEIIANFDKICISLENGIAKCREKAREALVNRNDMASFKLFARSMKYYQNMKTNMEAIKCQFENYLIQVEVANTFVGLKDVLGRTARMMDSMPSLKRNNRDFMKFKKSIMKGQLSMDSINSMMGDLDPSTEAELSPDELEAIRQEVLVGTSGSAIPMPNGQGQATPQAQPEGDVFAELDI